MLSAQEFAGLFCLSNLIDMLCMLAEVFTFELFVSFECMSHSECRAHKSLQFWMVFESFEPLNHFEPLKHFRGHKSWKQCEALVDEAMHCWGSAVNSEPSWILNAKEAN